MTASMVQSTGSADMPTKAAALLAETVLSTPAGSSDAAIISACAQLDMLEHEYCAVSLANEDDPRLDDIHAAQSPLVDLIGCTTAATVEGIRAKARSLALQDSSLMRSGPGDACAVLTGSILRDLIGSSVRQVALSASPDAAILAACGNVRRLIRLRDENPELADEPYRELMVQHREALLKTVRLPVTTPAGMAAIAKLILEERDRNVGLEHANTLFAHDLSERAAEAWLEALAMPAALTIDPDAAIFATRDALLRVKAERDALPKNVDDDVFHDFASRFSHGVADLAAMKAATDAGRLAQTMMILIDVDEELSLDDTEHPVRRFVSQIETGTTAPAPTDPDAEVIAVSEQIIGTEPEWAAVSLHENTLPLAQWHAYEATVRNPLADRSSELFGRLLEMQPTTPAGQQAAARALLAFMPRHDDGTPDLETNHIGEQLAWKLVGQLAGKADAVAAGLAQSALS
ncbi:MAG: hypothetical protein ACRYHQ_04040 [Janthinobacterium lividum]